MSKNDQNLRMNLDKSKFKNYYHSMWKTSTKREKPIGGGIGHMEVKSRNQEV